VARHLNTSVSLSNSSGTRYFSNKMGTDGPRTWVRSHAWTDRCPPRRPTKRRGSTKWHTRCPPTRRPPSQWSLARTNTGRLSPTSLLGETGRVLGLESIAQLSDTGYLGVVELIRSRQDLHRPSLDHAAVLGRLVEEAELKEARSVRVDTEPVHTSTRVGLDVVLQIRFCRNRQLKLSPSPVSVYQ
jgi:hypothetical protein